MKDAASLCLLTDLYELTMMQGYFYTQRDEKGVFEMFYRKQPFGGGYTVFAGLAPLLCELENLRFSDGDLNYLRSLGIFRGEFLEYLKTFAFCGNIFAIKEGTVAFPYEPLVRIHGSLMEAQLVESLVLNFINYQTLIATKAARIAYAAATTPVMEFGLRRAHGINGALSATRAAFIGGASSTSNVLAGKLFGIPVSGTMAHSWVMSFPTELEAFEHYATLYPEKCILLVDTFDTLKSGVPNAIRVFKNMKEKSQGSFGIRIDSGDLEYLSEKARQMLDENGCPDVKIVLSSDLDESIIAQLKERHTPVGFWGVGTKLVTGGGDPALTGVYKIVEKTTLNVSETCMKISDQEDKITNPGIKNIMRFYDADGLMIADLMFLEEERDELIRAASMKAPVRFNNPFKRQEVLTIGDYDRTEILLDAVMKQGAVISPQPSLKEIQEFRARQMQLLPSNIKQLIQPDVYRISLSDRLRDQKTSLMFAIQSRYKK